MSAQKITRIIAFAAAASFAALIPVPVIGVAPISAAERKGELHVTKDCPGNTFVGPWEFCTIKTSNFGRIKVNSRVYYVDPPNFELGLQDSAVVLDAGNGNRAIGRCTVDFATGLGLCTFSDGTGRFAGFRARVQVTPPADDTDYWHWDGTYSFGELD
jgi:hypothetical protein